MTRLSILASLLLLSIELHADSDETISAPLDHIFDGAQSYFLTPIELDSESRPENLCLTAPPKGLAQPLNPSTTPEPKDKHPIAASHGQGPLMAGASAKIITPRDEDGNLWMEPFEDKNGNGRYDPPNRLDPNAYQDPYTDVNGNGKWDGPWFGGYEPPNRFKWNFRGSYLYAKGVHDDLWARAIVLKVGDSKVAFVALDIVGLMVDDIQEIKEGVQDLRFDNILIGSTHNHAGPDTIGIFGPKHFGLWNVACALLFDCELDIQAQDGKDPRFMDHIRRQSIAALREADASLKEAQASFARAAPTEKYGHPSQEFRDWVPIFTSAYRDPVVVDKDIWAMHLKDAEGRAIGTLVNWTPHPNALGTRTDEISADFPHYLREAIEKGDFVVDGKHYEGLGGITVYFSGAIGGHLEPGKDMRDESGEKIKSSSYRQIQRIGEIAAAAVLAELQNAPIEPIHGIYTAAKSMSIPIENKLYELAYRQNLIQRKIYAEDGVSKVRTEVDFLALEGPQGPVAEFITVPGELFPEIAIGGYLPSEGKCWVEKDRTQETGWKGRERRRAANPEIPTEPVIKDMMNAPYKFLLGLTQDYLGYIVPANDFVFPAVSPILYGKDNCGSRQHYHEAQSVSPGLAPLVADAAQMLTHAYDDWRKTQSSELSAVPDTQ